VKKPGLDTSWRPQANNKTLCRGLKAKKGYSSHNPSWCTRFDLLPHHFAPS